MPRIAIDRRNDHLILRKSPKAHIPEFMFWSAFVLVLFIGILYVWFHGRSSFDRSLQILFPMLFLIPLCMLPKWWRSLKIISSGQEFVFDRSRGVFLNGRRISGFDEVAAVAIQVLPNGDGGPDSYRLFLRLKSGREVRLEEWINYGETFDVGTAVAFYFDTALETR